MLSLCKHSARPQLLNPRCLGPVVAETRLPQRSFSEHSDASFRGHCMGAGSQQLVDSRFVGASWAQRRLSQGSFSSQHQRVVQQVPANTCSGPFSLARCRPGRIGRFAWFAVENR
eukprot:11869011-Alexandrium_andersonii.AAC.1